MQPNRASKSNNKRTNNNEQPKRLRKSPQKPNPTNNNEQPKRLRKSPQKPNPNVLLRLPIKNTLVIGKFDKITAQLPLLVRRNLILIGVKKPAPNVTTSISLHNGVFVIDEVTTLSPPEQAPPPPTVNVQPDQQPQQQAPAVQAEATANTENNDPVPDVLANDQPPEEANGMPSSEAKLAIFDEDTPPALREQEGDIFNTLLELVDDGCFLDVIECPLPDCDKFGPPSALDNHYILKHCNEFVTDKNIFDNDFDLEKFLAGED